MSKFGGSLGHLRRATAPSWWPITRKGFVWAVKPSPGPHPASLSVPIAVILRDVLRYAYTLREVRRILAEKKVYVDWKAITDYKYPVGLMDTIYLKDAEEYYRMLPHPTKFYMLHAISEKESEIKPLRVKNKVTIKNAKIQLTFHDGRSLVIDTSNELYKSVRTLDTIVLNLKTKKILSHLPLKQGVIAYVINGRNVGFVGRVESIQPIFKRLRAVTELRSLDGQAVTRTILEYIMVVGKEEPAITLPTVEELQEWEKKLRELPPL